MKKFAYYISYLVWPFLTVLIYLMLQGKWLGVVPSLLFVLSILFIYARFVERQMIITKKTKIQTGFAAKLIVIADIHLGVYKKARFLERIVKKVNKIEGVDAVLIPGDLTYYPKGDLSAMFAALGKIKYPVYAVLGNHDCEKPGPPLQKALAEALKQHGVVFLNNAHVKIENKNISLLGLGDKWAGEDDVSLIDDFTEENNLIVLTHNPDTLLGYGKILPVLTIVGHTHGGQVRLPFIYKYVIPCVGDFDEGLYETEKGLLFVSAGLGETGLPVRLGMPPRIDVLELD